MGHGLLSGPAAIWHSCGVPLEIKCLAFQNWMVTSQGSVVNAAGAETVSTLFPGVVLEELSWPKLKDQGLC